MLICQIPDREHHQTQAQPRKLIRREDTEQIPNSRSQTAPNLQEDRCPDRGGQEYARYEYSIRNVQYSRKGRDHDPHPRDVAADDDRPGSPALERRFGSVELVFGQPDVPAVTSDEWPPVLPRNRWVAGASHHRPGDNGHVREQIWDRSGRRQVAAIGDRRITRRRKGDP